MKDFGIHVYGSSEWEVFDTFNGEAPASTGIAALVRLKDPLSLARAKGGIATAAAAAAPDMITSKVYSEFGKQMGESLKAKGIDADISIVEPKNFAAPSHTVRNIGFVVGGVSLLGAIGYLLMRRKSK